MTLDIAPAAVDRVVAHPPRRDRLKAAGFHGLLVLSLAVGLVSLGVLLVDTVVTGAPRLNMDLLRRFPSGRPALAGAQSAIMGTIWVVGICGLFSVAVGVGAAICLEEYADPARWYNRVLKVNIQNLAAVPSIVYGILGLGFLVRGIALGQVVLAAALTLSLLVLPIVVIASRQAIRAVPNSIRLASLRWERRDGRPSGARCCLPRCRVSPLVPSSPCPGPSARRLRSSCSEGSPSSRSTPRAWTAPSRCCPSRFNWISRPQEEFRVLAAAAIVVLLVILLAMNSAAILIRSRYQRKW